ncbi:concanavalin A-like lectin/glucanase domain-containing protein [Xylariales sp. PMI_506]|nr:concanavalin A-like lectin/glucanase domain-containing protein [Xylariales sp. PMI_506]
MSLTSARLLQATTKDPRQLRKELGYTPFEYWKGPKPVLPPAQRTLAKSHPSAPAAAVPRSNRQAPVSPIAAGSGYPKEKSADPWDTRSTTTTTAAAKNTILPASFIVSAGAAAAAAAAPTNRMSWDLLYGNRPVPDAAFQKSNANSDNVELRSGRPPSYSSVQLPPRPQKNMYSDPDNAPWWDCRYWRKRTWAILVFVVVVAIIAGAVAGVEVAKANRYPDYTYLNYTLSDTYSGTDFFDQFDYFTGYDPSSGFVHYVPQEEAESLNLTYASSSSAVLRVDTSVGNTSNPDASTGRFSVRVTSKTQYDSGLFIFDVKHTPYGCGTWPALWLTDPSNWPANGEIDVMEGVNQISSGNNQMTLHTTNNCEMDVKRHMSGSSIQTNCYNGTNDNAGCGVYGGSSSLGASFNSAGGGVMALEWRDAGIRMWQFGRDSIPSDITGKSPDPTTWGTAAADFPNTDCSISSHFRNQSIIANIDLCGSWVESVWSDDSCPSDCESYVANYPQAFKNAYWEFGSFEVYTAS